MAGGGGGGGPHAGPGAHPGPDRLPGHLRRRRPGVGGRPGERRAHRGRHGGAGEHGLRLPAAPGPRAALPPRLRGLRGALPAGDRLRAEALRGQAAEQRPGARGRLSGGESLRLPLRPLPASPRSLGPAPRSLPSRPPPEQEGEGPSPPSPACRLSFPGGGGFPPSILQGSPARAFISPSPG